MTAGRRLRGWLANLLLAFVSIAFVLAAFEIGLRLAGYRAIYEMYSKPSLFWRHDPLLGWSQEPGASGRYVGPRPWPIEFGATVSINSLGLRGPELPEKAGGELRVLFVGDSMVAGFEVEYEQTYVALLGQELTRRLGRPVRTINAGVRGYGTDQFYLYFVERGRALGADVVVVFHSGNDPADNTTLHETRRPFGKGALVPEAGGLRRVGIPVPQYPVCEEVSLDADYRIARGNSLGFRLACRAQMALFDHSALFSFVTISVPWNVSLLANLYYLGNAHKQILADPNIAHRSEHTQAISLALAREILASGATPIWTGGPDDMKQQLVLAELEREGARIRDLGDVWYEDPKKVRFLHDAHFNPVGHQRVVEILAPTIEAALRSQIRPAEALEK
ncbi:MAG TPA: SGNH/GDSL hydrolase family protein [Myxococcota bacterium]|jgi:lysophospholipase L1-like esterase